MDKIIDKVRCFFSSKSKKNIIEGVIVSLIVLLIVSVFTGTIKKAGNTLRNVKNQVERYYANKFYPTDVNKDLFNKILVNYSSKKEVLELLGKNYKNKFKDGSENLLFCKKKTGKSRLTLKNRPEEYCINVIINSNNLVINKRYNLFKGNRGIFNEDILKKIIVGVSNKKDIVELLGDSYYDKNKINSSPYCWTYYYSKHYDYHNAGVFGQINSSLRISFDENGIVTNISGGITSGGGGKRPKTTFPMIEEKKHFSYY